MLQFDPKHRPNAEQVLSRAEGIVESYSGHPGKQFLRKYEMELEDKLEETYAGVTEVDGRSTFDVDEPTSDNKSWYVRYALLLTGVCILMIPSETPPESVQELVVVGQEILGQSNGQDHAKESEQNRSSNTHSTSNDVSSNSVSITSPTKHEHNPLAVHDVTISSIPMGATVWIDDVEVGKTLLHALTIPEGYHSIRLELGGKMIEQDVQIKSSHRFVWQVNAESEQQWSTF